MAKHRRQATRNQYERMEALRPRTPDELHHFVERMFGLHIPRRPLVEGHDAPFDYLQHTMFEGNSGGDGDIVVWANRGGGKTQLGAIATLLDLLFKPGIEVCILGGSFEQSTRMYRYLQALVHRPMLRPMLAGEPTQRRLELVNGSRVDALTQSQTNIRGRHVHKLRCDEVELFGPDVWQAVQMVTRSGRCGPVTVRGAIEAISTMHRPYGLMRRIIDRPDRPRVLRWCYLDVIEQCPPARNCEDCPLWHDCRGRAKQADGFLSIDDMIAQQRRTSDETWASEMMCRRPRHDTSVYPNFEVRRHVRAAGNVDQTADGAQHGPGGQGVRMIGGMDFGLRSPLVMLWARLIRATEGSADDVIHVVDEYYETGLTLDAHLERISHRGWGALSWIGVDPAGGQRNSQTGISDIEVLRERGYRVRSRPTRIRPGIETVRRRLDRGTLVIAPGCHRLIESMHNYHFDADRPNNEQPVKDGPDHACDALRYMLVNLEAGGRVVARRRYTAV